MKNIYRLILSAVLFLSGILLCPNAFAQNVQEPCVAGQFYPDNPKQLSAMIDDYLEKANPEPVNAEIFGLISPHAGYGFSGQTAAFGFKLIKGKPYKTVVIIGTSHHRAFDGAALYPAGGIFKTPLGALSVDSEFTQKLLNKDPEIVSDPVAFEGEHSVEVQLPFLQKTLENFKIVPIILSDCSLSTCQKIASLLKDAIGARHDVLVVVSTDMYHGYDYDEANATDNLTLEAIKNMDAEGLYFGLRDGKMQLCGGFGAVSALTLAKELGHNKAILLKHTNSAEVTANMKKGIWTVGYASIAIDSAQENIQPTGEKNMLNKSQRKKLLQIARGSIESYLKSGKSVALKDSDPILSKQMGAFVTLNERGQLRGCIGNLVGNQPLYLTIRDMAIEAATRDPRFEPVNLEDLKDIEIEISVLSQLEKIDNPDKIKLGEDGVLVRSGLRSGVFLPQVATETGWSKEEFMSNLCVHKAGLPADAWKDKTTEIYIFSAEVFSEKELANE